MSPEDRIVREKRLAYNRWRLQLKADGLWKKRENHKGKLDKVIKQIEAGQLPYSGGEVEAPVDAKAEAAKPTSVKEIRGLIKSANRVLEIGTRLKAIAEEEAALRAEASKLLAEE
jgi:hypothetical protein